MLISIFIRCSIWLLLLRLVNSLPQQVPQTTDVIQSGPYSIYACGIKAAFVKNALNLLWADLLPAINDSMTGITSPAYEGLFKDDYYAPYVTRVLTKVSTGAQITTPRTRGLLLTPLLACATASGEVTMRMHTKTIDMYDKCMEKGAPPAFAWSNNHWLILCPAYFTSFPLKAVKPIYCPSTNFISNQMRLYGQLIFYQPYVLLHELAHLYIWSASGAPPGPYNETYDWNGALDLPAFNSTQNPNNYAFYVAALAAGCTDFGDPGDIPDPITCRSRCLSMNVTALMVGHNNSSGGSTGSGDSTISDVIHGDGLTIEGVQVEDDGSSDFAGRTYFL